MHPPPQTPPPGRRGWVVDVLPALLVAGFGLVDAVRTAQLLEGRTSALAWVVVGTTAAVATWRRLPALGIGLAWLTCALQVVTYVPPLVTQVALALVAFGAARWGRPVTVVVAGVSLPLGVLVGLLLLRDGWFPASGGSFREALAPLTSSSTTIQVGVVLLGLGTLALPWLAGLAVRFLARARRSQEQQLAAEAREQESAEVARLRSDQARLAADVHDVVGHSLAVILAQAESGQYLPDDDPARLKQTLAVIATSARTSLQDVRAVLQVTRSDDTAPAAVPVAVLADLDDLVEGIRRSGREVVDEQTGRPQPLPPELAQVAYRVLQEMVTNALRHGRRDAPVLVQRSWDDELRIRVDNGSDGAAPTPGGRGLAGMRDRLASVGGRLDVQPGADRFAVTARLPVRR
ncbi:Signal transduction histidine kinase [Klenkia soli]|uniref:histidine kinase n=1 Tax=Klenkia soli TaxID=1052260 RepID=A0A1H0TDI3_9ACTN|nr:histidine kinase [Klenkia soli]SDP51576.1 Signal transduction histidine kinase [Klenkia soli]